MPTYKQLTQEQRYRLDVYCQEGFSRAKIAKLLGTHRSTIYRELARNSSSKGYQGGFAQDTAETRRAECKAPVVMLPDVIEVIEEKLREDWSPEQISCTLRLDDPGFPSAQSIYTHIEWDADEGGDLWKHLRFNGKGKKRRKRRTGPPRRELIPDRQDIIDRPKIIEQRLRFGDWEADLIVGAGNSGYILVVVERKSRYTLTRKLQYKDARTVARALQTVLRGWRVLSITFDNGLEFARHGQVALALGCQTWFCRPYASWQKGLCENTNGLLRQYFRKKDEFWELSNYLVENAAQRLNSRPRKTLGWKKPENYVIDLQLAA